MNIKLRNPFTSISFGTTAPSIKTRFIRTALSVTLCSLSLFSYAGTPHKLGAEFEVYKDADKIQRTPSIARLNSESYVVVWESLTNDYKNEGIFAQLYNFSGEAIGSKFRVNTQTQESQKNPTVALLKDGSFIVVWQTVSDNPQYGSHLLAQRFNMDGTPIGGELQLDQSPVPYYTHVSIAPLNNGGFVVGWHSQNKSFAKIYRANAFEINTINLDEGLQFPDITSTADGGFIAVALSSGHIIAQRYDANGFRKGSQIKVSDGDPTTKFNPTISRLSSGEFIVIWEHTYVDESSDDILARRLDADGNPKGETFKVNSHTEKSQLDIAIEALENGGYIITWMDYADETTEGDVYAQAFLSDDTRNGDEFQVNHTAGYYAATPAIRQIGSDDFLISWSNYNLNFREKIYAQRFQLDAERANTLTPLLPQTQVLEGDIVTLPLKVTGTDIYGLDAVVSLSDTTKARIYGGEYGEFLPSDERLSVPMGINDQQWDGALALMVPAIAKTGEGEFASVTLVAEQAGTVRLSLQSQIADQQGDYLLQNNTDYSFTIAESVTLTGNISSLSTAGDYAFVTLLINGQPVTINPDGSFSVRLGLGDVTMALSTPGYLMAEKQVYLRAGQADIDFGQINLVGGDSNGDNHIDIADLTLLLGAYRSVEGQQNGYVMAADFNRDGAINLRDLTLLGANFGKQGPQSW
ncbi:dockerin type I domain-containing protein [Pseudoalteromonas rubra]|uniref:Dockerin domain-containing protein n=1 Tax=Pseudoalteromonas rubra TaxID=43658 RepID=A0A5S3X1S9_9GAMM|nr:dockerin type I domain-containing protein [Pseudoalteromonas rubra]TMP37625.1 hypothetical protein CWB98_10640 [Pseudoalteromonas rubra]